MTIPKTRKFYDAILGHIATETKKKEVIPLIQGGIALVVDKVTRKVYNTQTLKSFVMHTDLEFVADLIEIPNPTNEQLNKIRYFNKTGGQIFWDDKNQDIIIYRIFITPIGYDYFNEDTFTYVFIGKQDIEVLIEIMDEDGKHLSLDSFSEIVIKNKGMFGVKNNLLINGSNDLKVNIPPENPQIIKVHVGDMHEECIIKFKCRSGEWIANQISVMVTD